MMFQADTAIAVELIALVAGTFLLIWSCKDNVTCRGFAKFVAYLTIVISIVSILCTSYYAFKYWEEGVFNTPHVFNTSHMNNKMMYNHSGNMPHDMMNMHEK